jgi:N-acetylglucosaminyl-diphospho-decaprenol L-rhamnosyltransferase
MRFSISIVSHNSGTLIANLLKDLVRNKIDDGEIILTINTPEDESFLDSAVGLPMIVIRNPTPLGFGANHNQAFERTSGERFLIVNPDVRIQGDPWHVLDAAFDSDTGACAPMIYSPAGTIEDSVRHYPTIGKLLKRAVLGIRCPDYIAPQTPSPVEVDWVAGMFVMFDSVSFRTIGGFDTRYFMYLEDVDICRRLVSVGKKILWVPTCSVIHDAQRASRKSWRHRSWHARSMIRFFLGV